MRATRFDILMRQLTQHVNGRVVAARNDNNTVSHLPVTPASMPQNTWGHKENLTHLERHGRGAAPADVLAAHILGEAVLADALQKLHQVRLKLLVRHLHPRQNVA